MMSLMYLMKVGRKGPRLLLVPHSYKQVPPYWRKIPFLHGRKGPRLRLFSHGGKMPLLHGFLMETIILTMVIIGGKMNGHSRKTSLIRRTEHLRP